MVESRHSRSRRELEEDQALYTVEVEEELVGGGRGRGGDMGVVVEVQSENGMRVYRY